MVDSTTDWFGNVYGCQLVYVSSLCFQSMIVVNLNRQAKDESTSAEDDFYTTFPRRDHSFSACVTSLGKEKISNETIREDCLQFYQKKKEARKGQCSKYHASSRPLPLTLLLSLNSSVNSTPFSQLRRLSRLEQLKLLHLLPGKYLLREKMCKINKTDSH